VIFRYILKRKEIQWSTALEKVVPLALCKELEGKSVQFDNYFTGVDLVQKFKLAGLGSCRTIMSNRRSILTLKEAMNSKGKHEYSARPDDRLAELSISSVHTPLKLGK
jgi:hypothetical protein